MQVLRPAVDRRRRPPEQALPEAASPVAAVRRSRVVGARPDRARPDSRRPTGLVRLGSPRPRSTAGARANRSRAAGADRGRAAGGGVDEAGPRPGEACQRATAPGTTGCARRRAEAGRGRLAVAAAAAAAAGGGSQAGLRRRPQRVLPGHPGRPRRPWHHRQPRQRDVQRWLDRGRRASHRATRPNCPPASRRTSAGSSTTSPLSTPGVTHALIVSSDGLPLITSTGLAPDLADPLAAMTSGIISIGNNIASQVGEPGCEQVMLEVPVRPLPLHGDREPGRVRRAGRRKAPTWAWSGTRWRGWSTRSGTC